MQSLQANLQSKLSNAARVAIVGVGSELRADDVAGVLVAQSLKKILVKSKKSPPVKIFLGGIAPENFTGEIKKFKPSHLLIVDAADFGGRPGALALLKPQDIGGASFNTHKLPTRFMAEYLAVTEAFDITIIGIQPKSIRFGAPPCAQVKKSARLLAAIIKHALRRK